MKTALWIIQILLAVLYLMGGLWKLAGKAPDMEAMMPGFSLTLIRIIGVLEAAAAVGLVLPAVLRRGQSLTVLAAGALAVEAVVFVVYHCMHGKYGPAAATLVLGLLAAFVAWGRKKTAAG